MNYKPHKTKKAKKAKKNRIYTPPHEIIPHHRERPLSLQMNGDPPTPPEDHLPGDQTPQRA
jgi:hypothetical protein